MSALPGIAPAEDAWADVIGQPAAVAVLRAAVAGDPPHAWLFVGPPGTGKREAARAFAGDILAADQQAAGDEDGAARSRALARREQHPDLIAVERVGSSIAADQAAQVVTRASRSAVEGRRKVMLLDEFHLVQPTAGARLLKTIEEPPRDTYFVILADDVPPELVTVASRCVRVDFDPLPPSVVVDALVAEGIEPARAAEVAAHANGDLDRARLLATDERLALRLAAWRDLPRRLDGTGARAAVAIDELRAAIDDAAAPLATRHAAEVEELNERIERYGQRGSGAADLAARHKREVRRLRTDELRMGLGALAGTYRDEMAVAADPMPMVAALGAIQELAERIIRNPNEELQLLALVLQLPSLA